MANMLRFASSRCSAGDRAALGDMASAFCVCDKLDKPRVNSWGRCAIVCLIYGCR